MSYNIYIKLLNHLDDFSKANGQPIFVIWQIRSLIDKIKNASTENDYKKILLEIKMISISDASSRCGHLKSAKRSSTSQQKAIKLKEEKLASHTEETRRLLVEIKDIILNEISPELKKILENYYESAPKNIYFKIIKLLNDFGKKQKQPLFVIRRVRLLIDKIKINDNSSEEDYQKVLAGIREIYNSKPSDLLESEEEKLEPHTEESKTLLAEINYTILRETPDKDLSQRLEKYLKDLQEQELYDTDEEYISSQESSTALPKTSLTDNNVKEISAEVIEESSLVNIHP